MEPQERGVISIDSFDDPRLTHYCNLKDRELARDGDRFVVESEWVVRRLLASPYPVESILCVTRKAAELAPFVPEPIPFYVAADSVVDRIIGYKFHTGVIAVARRLAPRPLEDVLPRSGPSTVVVCPDLTSLDNLGAILRSAAAFGVDGVVLGPRCCDPFYRMAVRVSMGAVFKLPIHRSGDWPADLVALKRLDYRLIATVLDPTAAPPGARPPRVALLLGNEAAGLSTGDVALADDRVTLPMDHGTDSLNVAAAAAVFLYHYTRLSPPT